MTEQDTGASELIMQLGFGFWGSKTLLSAVELGVFTELATEGPLGADALAGRLGLAARGTRDFLDALVALHMLDRADDVYRNTPATERFLDRLKPTYLGGMLQMANERLYPFWGSLTEALRTGRPQNEAKRGRAKNAGQDDHRPGQAQWLGAFRDRLAPRGHLRHDEPVEG